MKMMMEQKQMMKMVMTQELRQAIELLQLSTYEMFQFIQEKANENPFIELTQKEDQPNFYQRTSTNSDNDTFDPIMNATKTETSLHEYLFEQLLHLELTEEEMNVIQYFVLNINEHGFLDMENELICEHLNVTNELVERARELITSLEPCGIGAANAIDCLYIQARRHYPENDLLQHVILHHLQDLADKRWDKIAKTYNTSLENIQHVFQTIQTFNPRPAMGFATTNVNYTTPDLTIAYNEEDDLTIQLHEHYIPNLYFNRDYIPSVNKTKELSQYVQHQFKQYEWLQTSIEQRRSTILKIMRVIVARQADFFKKGFRYLKPLTLKDVADEIDMHESTVSRATANKIIQTPVGIFELKQLFSTKISSTHHEENSQAEVKNRIKELIEKEDKFKPLSDQKIANCLKEQQINISRRTVAKYREEMFILSSSKRKEVKV